MTTAPVQPTKRLQRRRRLGIAVAAIAAIALMLAGVVWWQQDALVGEEVDPGTPLPAAPNLTKEELAFYEYVAPRLRAVTAEAQKLAELGRGKSRNVIELQRRGDRIGDISQQIDDYMTARPVPVVFAPGMQRYSVGIEAARRATEESRSAFVTFDWERVAKAVDVMETGAADLASAVRELEQAAGTSAEASPTTVAD
jgi:hypothetical protein